MLIRLFIENKLYISAVYKGVKKGDIYYCLDNYWLNGLKLEIKDRLDKEKLDLEESNLNIYLD